MKPQIWTKGHRVVVDGREGTIDGVEMQGAFVRFDDGTVGIVDRAKLVEAPLFDPSLADVVEAEGLNDPTIAPTELFLRVVSRD